MVIVSTTFVVTLLALVALAAISGVGALAVAAERTLVHHHRARVARHESIRSYYGHLAHAH